MAQDFVNLIGNVSPEEMMNLSPDHRMLLIEGKAVRCRQMRYYEEFCGPVKS